jgi:hypothetical protein
VFEVTRKAAPRGEDQGAWLALREECGLKALVIVVGHIELQQPALILSRFFGTGESVNCAEIIENKRGMS